jgi:hypothetical protein
MERLSHAAVPLSRLGNASDGPSDRLYRAARSAQFPPAPELLCWVLARRPASDTPVRDSEMARDASGNPKKT